MVSMDKKGWLKKINDENILRISMKKSINTREVDGTFYVRSRYIEINAIAKKQNLFYFL